VEPTDQRAVYIPADVSQHLLLPLAEVGRPAPQPAIDAEHAKANRAFVDEHVLAGLGTETLTKEHEARSPLRCHAIQPLGDGKPQLAVLEATFVDAVERERGRALGV